MDLSLVAGSVSRRGSPSDWPRTDVSNIHRHIRRADGLAHHEVSSYTDPDKYIETFLTLAKVAEWLRRARDDVAR